MDLHNETQEYKPRRYNITPLGEHVAVKPSPPRPRVTKHGIELPETSEERPDEGEIIAIGPNVEDPRVRSGVLVAYSKYAGSEIIVDIGEEDDAEVLILSEKDLLAILTEKQSEDLHSDIQSTGDASHSENAAPGRCIP